MIWFNRMLVLALVLCLNRTPLPWGHSRCGMDSKELAIHLCKYHPATSENELPTGWHWHISRIETATDVEVGHFPILILQERLGEPLAVTLQDCQAALY